MKRCLIKRLLLIVNRRSKFAETDRIKYIHAALRQMTTVLIFLEVIGNSGFDIEIITYRIHRFRSSKNVITRTIARGEVCSPVVLNIVFLR